MHAYYSFARTSIGYSHLASQKPCQDCSAVFPDEGVSVIVVSDGHGSANFTRSDRGSRFACEVAGDAAKEFLRNLNVRDLEDEQLRDSIVEQLCKNIILRWNSLVTADAESNPFTEEEVDKVADKYKRLYLDGTSVEHAYGCTLILVLLTRDFCLAIRNGDGQFVAVSRDGSFSTPIPWNDNCEFNVTTSLCDENAIENFRYYYSALLPAAVFAGSDGVDDSYTSVEELYGLYGNICLKALHDGVETVAEYVETLLPMITRCGSADDVSVAGALDPAALEDARPALEAARERQQMLQAEARREQQKRILIKDIKVAEKKKAKAESRLLDVRESCRRAAESRDGFWGQILAPEKKPDDGDACGSSLSEEEKQLTDLLEETDREIARLRDELHALDAQTAGSDNPASGAPISSDASPAEGDA